MTAFVFVAGKFSRGCSSSFLPKGVLTNVSTYDIIGIPALGLADIAIDGGYQNTKGDTTSFKIAIASPVSKMQ